ncbi:TolC family outer membrane protein [bacterium]|nr:TolC family outer membrane protein [bacterium]
MRKVLSALLLGAVSFAPGALWAETLTDALISAYRNSHLLEQNQAVLRAADEDVATAVGQLLPVVTFATQVVDSRSEQFAQTFGGVVSAGQSTNVTGGVSLTASLTLLDFGRNKLNIAAKNELVLASQQSLVNYEQQVLLDAVSAYVNMSLQTELVAAQESNVHLITQDLQATRDRFDVGEVTKTDVAQAEAQLASANASLVSAQGNLTLARERYNAAIGHYPTSLSPLPKTPISVKSLAEARAVALRTHPVILQAQHQAKAADIGVQYAKAQFGPTVSGKATVLDPYRYNQFIQPTTQLELDWSQTIYAGGQYSSAYRKAIAQQEQAHAAQLQTGVNVTEAVGKAWSNILVAQASITANDEQIRAAQAAYDGVKQEAELGSRTTLDVLNAEQTLLSAKASRLQAQANFYTGQYSLLSAMGLLTATNLHLGIPVFDPQVYYDAVKGAPTVTVRGARLDKIMKKLGK